MNLQEIKTAVGKGKTVRWGNSLYQVVKGVDDKYYIDCTNGSCIRLTWLDGTTLNGEESEFYIEEK